jgi:hypothetical protein
MILKGGWSGSSGRAKCEALSLSPIITKKKKKKKVLKYYKHLNFQLGSGMPFFLFWYWGLNSGPIP